jgi:hypothetical protein
MPALDFFHANVRTALERDGWTITHDPYTVAFGQRGVYVDLGAERVVAAEKGCDKIAVEIKSFRGASDIADLELSLGQFVFYRSLLARTDPQRKLYLAVPDAVFESTFSEPIAQPVLQDLQVPLVTFEPATERIVQWIR